MTTYWSHARKDCFCVPTVSSLWQLGFDMKALAPNLAPCSVFGAFVFRRVEIITWRHLLRPQQPTVTHNHNSVIWLSLPCTAVTGGNGTTQSMEDLGSGTPEDKRGEKGQNIFLATCWNCRFILKGKNSLRATYAIREWSASFLFLLFSPLRCTWEFLLQKHRQCPSPRHISRIQFTELKLSNWTVRYSFLAAFVSNMK